MPADLAHCRAVAFDAYGTLFDVHSATAKESKALGDKADPVSQLWRQKQLEYTWLRSLMGRYVDFWQVTRDGLDFALATYEVQDEDLAERLLQLYLRLDAYPDVKPLLEALKKGGRTAAILTNAEPKMIQAAVASSGLDTALDRILSAEPLRIFKPHPSVYELAVKQLKVHARELCFVSTNSWDARGAADFGFQVVWLNRFGRVPDRIPGEFKATIKTLDELPALLGL